MKPILCKVMCHWYILIMQYRRIPFNTVDSRYLELKPVSLGFAYCFSVIYYWLSRTRLSRIPRYLEQSMTSRGLN